MKKRKARHKILLNMNPIKILIICMVVIPNIAYSYNRSYKATIFNIVPVSAKKIISRN